MDKNGGDNGAIHFWDGKIAVCAPGADNPRYATEKSCVRPNA